MKFLIASHHHVKFSSHGPCCSSEKAAETFYFPARPRHQRIWWLHGRELLIVYPHAAKIDSHRYCINGYIILVCNLILQDHMFIQSCDFMGRSHTASHHPAKFVAIGIVVLEMFLVFHVISQTQVIIWSFDFKGKGQSSKSPCCKFWSNRYCISGDIMVLVRQLILQDYEAKGWSNIIIRSPRK